MKTIDIRTLSFGAKVAICWSFFWRGSLIAIGSMLAGGVLGAVFGAVIGFGFAAAGLSLQSIKGVSQVVGGVLGLSAGLFFFYIYVRWLLGSRLGSYRLILVSAEETSNRSFQATAGGGA
jgi:hypothetical protein